MTDKDNSQNAIGVQHLGVEVVSRAIGGTIAEIPAPQLEKILRFLISHAVMTEETFQGVIATHLLQSMSNLNKQ